MPKEKAMMSLVTVAPAPWMVAAPGSSLGLMVQYRVWCWGFQVASKIQDFRGRRSTRNIVDPDEAVSKEVAQKCTEAAKKLPNM